MGFRFAEVRRRNRAGQHAPYARRVLKVGVDIQRPPEHPARWLIRTLNRTPESWHGRTIQNEWLNLELGRVQPMLMPTGDGRFVMRQAVSIRNIEIATSHRRLGVFKTLVRWLLNKYGCVELEAVVNKWLFKKLAKSPLWSHHSAESNSFARCLTPADRLRPFALFA